MMEAIRQVVVAANHYGPQDVPELRMRMNLIGIGARPAVQRRPALRRLGAGHQRLRRQPARASPPTRCIPLAIGRATLAACRAAYDRWSARADADLTFYLDAALMALAAGFDPAVVRAAVQELTPQKG